MERRVVRAVFAGVLVLCAAYLVFGAVTADPSFPERVADDKAIAPPSDGITVVTTQSYGKAGWQLDVTGDSPGEIVAVDENGSVVYYNNSYSSYWDVDPDPEGSTTVLYVASQHLSPKKCSATVECYRNDVVRTNLTTGESSVVYSRIVRNEQSVRWHDVDRLDEHRLVVADIAEDRVFVVDTRTGRTTWQWSVAEEYETSSGGAFPKDWSHLNDVEVVENNTIMVSLRNQDSVVFIDMENGFIHDRTLGSDGEHTTLYEQHNPDYIPAADGEESVLVSDSENNRVVEYERSNGDWVLSWQWSKGLWWPRDADRLPNGHTLITDSNNNRVIEVDERGDVVWSMQVPLPYEAERLGTGDESTGGPTAAAGNLSSVTSSAGDTGSQSLLRNIVFTIFPSALLIAISWVLPAWMGIIDAGVLFGGIGLLGVWMVLELYWSAYTVRLSWPIRIEKK